MRDKTGDQTVRLLDLGEVSYLRSQTIYHAVARAMDENSPNTIVITSPREPYACIGFHQDLEQEIDVGYCRARRLPVLRREIGGGAVYLDRHQVFYHCVFHRFVAPRRVDDIYRMFLRGPIETYRQLGVEAALDGLNDIAVEDRKIGGTGAGTIGEAVVVGGSIILDFDHSTMASLLRTPSDAFRSQVEEQMRRYVTSLNSEVGRDIPSGLVRDTLASQFARTLGVKLGKGALGAAELALAQELDSSFLSDEWLRAIVRPVPEVRQVKIRAGVVVCEAECRYNGGDARATLSLVQGIVSDFEVSGDLVLDDAAHRRLRAAIVGHRLDSDEALRSITQALGEAHRPSADMIQSCLSSIRRAIGSC